MNVRAISALKTATVNAAHDPNDNTSVEQFRFPVSRRQFVRNVAGTAALGTARGSGLETPETVRPRWSFAPVPIPHGSPALGGFYHIFAPGPAAGNDPIDAEPATITNLDGFVGLAYLSGNVTQTDRRTGEQQLFRFVDSDMRFLQGNFRGTDGHIHKAAFALV